MMDAISHARSNTVGNVITPILEEAHYAHWLVEIKNVKFNSMSNAMMEIVSTLMAVVELVKLKMDGIASKIKMINHFVI